ncbi:MAG: alpha/beta hydrolase [Wenzhouxiangellaceae bacterium]
MTTAYRMFVAMILALSAAGLRAETPAEWPAGDWKGTLQAGQQQLEMVYHLATGPDGDWTGSMDVPAQGAMGLPLQSIEISDTSITITIAMPLPGEASYEGTWNSAEQRIDGRFSQAGQSFPLVLERTQGEVAGPVRPQEPKAPLPYRSEVVTLPNAGTSLAGTLTLPDEQSSFPGIVLVAGAGPHDRDGTFMNHRPLLVLADHLTRAGFAVLRFDERGIGNSEGEFAGATADQLAGDIAAAAQFLRGHESVDAGKITIIAHSEGGRLSALAIETHQAANGLVLLGAPARPGIEGLRSEAGQSSSPIAGLQLAVAEAALGVEVGADARPAMRAAAEQSLAALEPQQRAAFGGQEDAVVGQLVQAIGQPQAQFSLRFDPRPALKSAAIPVLVLYGDKDRQIDARGEAQAWRDALGDGVDVTMLAGLNHFFQQANTGAATEYASIEQTISPTALKTIVEWLQTNLDTGDEQS